MINWLLRPYPIVETFQGKCALSFVLGLVVAAVLLVFQPFEIREIQSIKLLSIGGFGMVTTMITFGMLLIVDLIPLFGYRDQKWNVGQQILFLALLLCLVTVGNWWLDSSISEISRTRCHSLKEYFGITLIVGIFPLLFSIFCSEKVIRSRNTETAEDLTREIQGREAKIHPLPVAVDQFLYAQAEGNYLQIFSTGGQPALLRITMKELENIYAEEPKILRCHRSFMVNSLSVVTVNGNAGGLLLNLKSGAEVPVSRSYVPVIKASIASHLK